MDEGREKRRRAIRRMTLVQAIVALGGSRTADPIPSGQGGGGGQDSMQFNDAANSGLVVILEDI